MRKSIASTGRGRTQEPEIEWSTTNWQANLLALLETLHLLASKTVVLQLYHEHFKKQKEENKLISKFSGAPAVPGSDWYDLETLETWTQFFKGGRKIRSIEIMGHCQWTLYE